MKHNQRIGKWGEEKASEYLTQTRCDVIYSKVWTPYGEIDFIARRGATTLF